MDTPGLPPWLSEFLAEPARAGAWELPPGTRALAESEFQVQEQVLESGTRGVPEGRLMLTRVTYRPLSPADLATLAGYRAGLEDTRLVMAMFWFALGELPARRSYGSVRIRVRLAPPAPVLLLSPDRAEGAAAAWRAVAAEITAIVAALVPDGLAAVGLDFGDEGFGWQYETRGETELPQHFTTVALLELPSAADRLAGVLDADAQISRSVLGKSFPRKASLVNLAMPIDVPFQERPGARPAPAGKSQPERYDLGLIVPLREEYDRVREIFDFGPQIEENGRYRYPFSIPGTERRGVAIVLHGMGPTLTGVEAANLLSRFDLPVLALVGIAGALDSGLRLGDVVVASLVDPYLDRAKARPGAEGEAFPIDSGGSAWRPGRRLVSFADHFRYRADETDETTAWRSRGAARRKEAGLPGDGVLARPEPDYVVGAIASGDLVAASVDFAGWMRRQHRQCVAVEMEASGVAQAVYEHGRSEMLIVRGISDFADERKEELDATAAAGAAGPGAWRRYAALNAADLLASLLRSPGFPWPAANERDA